MVKFLDVLNLSKISLQGTLFVEMSFIRTFQEKIEAIEATTEVPYFRK